MAGGQDRSLQRADRALKLRRLLGVDLDAERRADLSDAFKYALIRKQYVNWGAGFCCSESAADVLYNASTAETDEVWRDLQAAIANGAPDADVAALVRHWHRLALGNAVDTLVVCAQQGQHITFPSTVR